MKFVQYCNVRDVKNLAIRLDNMVLEGMEFFANIPRFNRQEGVKNKNLVHRIVRKEASNAERKDVTNKQGWIDRKSFKEVIQGQSSNISVHKIKTSLEFHLEEEEVKRYSQAYTRVLREAGMAASLTNLFLDEGIFSIT